MRRTDPRRTQPGKTGKAQAQAQSSVPANVHVSAALNVRRRFHGFVSFQSRGVVAFPAELRERLCADLPGAQLEVIEREDGVIELHPCVPVPADQQWFWSERWQAMEREADADIAAGRVATFESAEDFLADLDG